MSKKKASKQNTSIPFEILVDGYEKSVDNGFELSKAGMELYANGYRPASLGLSELGQEEIGKSLSLLAAFALPSDDAWSWFWSAWKDHTIKAHRAFLYELINPMRIEIFNPQGVSVAAGLPLRDKIALEKEAAFYVEYDGKTQTFISPVETVDHLEVFNRITTLATLAVTAWHVRNALTSDGAEFRLRAFGELAFRICTEEIYQQDMASIFESIAARSVAHSELIHDLKVELQRARASHVLQYGARGVRSPLDAM